MYWECYFLWLHFFIFFFCFLFIFHFLGWVCLVYVLWPKIHRCMVGLSALCVGVRIYGDVWRNGACKPLIWDRSVRGLGELVAVVHVFHTSSSLYTCICRINMGICILPITGSYHTRREEFICMFICYRYVRVYWYDGVLGLCLSKSY